MPAQTTRRGLLGLFAAAVPAAAIASMPVSVIAPPQDWRTKPTDDWTKADYLAEAEYQVSALRRKAEAIRAVAPDPERDPGYRAVSGGLEWWERELSHIKGGIQTAGWRS